MGQVAHHLHACLLHPRWGREVPRGCHCPTSPCTPGQCLALVSAEQTLAEDVIARGQGSAEVLGLTEQMDHRLTGCTVGRLCGLGQRSL